MGAQGAASGDRAAARGRAVSQARTLRPYQEDVIARFEAEVVTGRQRVLLVAATGSGKTVIASAIVKTAVQRGARVVFLAHRRELIKQASRKLYDVGIDHGIIQARFPARPGEPVQLASVQTLHARAVRTNKTEMPPANLIVVDEAHHVRAWSYRNILEAYPRATVLGLTATPFRGDGRGLGNAFEVLVESLPVAELIRQKFLVPAKVYAPVRPDLTGIHVQRGDYVERELAQRMNTAKLVGDIVEHWHKLGERRRTVVFAVSVAHSVHLRDEFRRSDVLAEHIDGSTPVKERDAILASLAASKIEIVTNCQVLTEGWDCHEVSCIVLARPTKSFGLYLQMMGRVLRPASGKTDALVLDHAGAVFQHGFVDDPVVWTLHEDQRVENKAHSARGQYKAPALTTCPECSAVRYEGQPCPVCHWRPVTKPQHVDVADGQLGAVDRNRGVAKPSGDERLNFYRQLLYIAGERGYKDGWAWHKTKEKFGTAPSGNYAPLEPDPAVRAWVRSRAIAFAKGLAKRPG